MRQPGLDAGLFLCNAKGTPGETGAATTELQMDQFHTPVENTKLSPWFFAVNWGIITLQQKIGDNWKLFFQAKNLLNPEIQTVYRSPYLPNDILNTSYTAGIDFAVGLSFKMEF